MTQDNDQNPGDDAPLDLPLDTWLAVVRAYNECTTTLAHRLVPLGLSVLEHEVLMNLLRSKELTQQQLSQRCFSAKSGISMLVTRFEADALIVRRRSTQDQRAWMLSLTPEGKTLGRQAYAIQSDVVAAMAETFSKSELNLVKSRMDTTSARLQAMRSG